MTELEMSFDPHTIEHLGIKMYSRAANAIAELVANAYDADAENVTIKLYDENEFKIIVQDDGNGMSFDEINDCFLRIGRKRRESDKSRITSKGRVITGKKGLGKLALFGIGKNINIITTKSNSVQEISFNLNWDEIVNQVDGTYKPKHVLKMIDLNNHGTQFILSDLKRKSKFDINIIADALARLFNFINNDFLIKIILNDKDEVTIKPSDKYNHLDTQFEWDVATLCEEIDSEYQKKSDLKGKIISTLKPTPSNYRGITLYVNGRLANAAGFFGISEAPVALSYISGWINADFIDEETDELISTDRQSLNWDLEEATELQGFLFKLVRLITKKWNEQRKVSNLKKTKEKTGVDVKTWTDTMPQNLKENVVKIVEQIINKPEIDDEITSEVINKLHTIT